MDLQLLMQSVPITTNVVSSNPVQAKFTRFDTTVCNQICRWLATGQWFSPETPVSSINKIDRHDVTEIFLKVAFVFPKYHMKYFSVLIYPEKTWLFCTNCWKCFFFDHYGIYIFTKFTIILFFIQKHKKWFISINNKMKIKKNTTLSYWFKSLLEN